MKEKHKLDIFDVMAAIDRRDTDFLDRQEPDTKKAFTPLVAMRWASAVQGPQAENYLILTNEFANIHFHDLYEHPELQFKLLTMAGCGKSVRHQWIPTSKRSKAVSKICEFVGQYYPLASDYEIDNLVSRFDYDGFAEFVYSTGCSPEETKEILNVFKKKA